MKNLYLFLAFVVAIALIFAEGSNSIRGEILLETLMICYFGERIIEAIRSKS